MYQGVKFMLKKFEVKNFKGFKEKLVFDLSNARDYAFNTNQVEDGIVKKSSSFAIISPHHLFC